MNKPPNPFADLEALRREAEVVEFPAAKTASQGQAQPTLGRGSVALHGRRLPIDRRANNLGGGAADLSTHASFAAA